MWTATWKSLWARRTRLLMSTLAVVLGVAFVAGSFIFTDMLKGSFEAIVRGSVADVEVQPRTDVAVTGSDTDDPLISSDMVSKINAVPGVTRAVGVITTTGVYAVGSNGKALASFGPPQLGMAWTTLPAYGGQPGLVLTSGHEPRGDDQIVVDPTTLDKSGYRLGDQMRVVTPDKGTIRATLVGTATWGTGGTAGASYIFFTPSRAQTLLINRTGADRNAWTGVSVQTDPGADRDSVAQAINGFLPSNFKATNGATIADRVSSQINDSLKYVNTFLLIFAGISLVVAAFLILNTFSILIAQRSGELALYRAIGASRKQLRNSVLVEAAVVGLAGSALGVLAGIGVAQLIKTFMTMAGFDLGVTSIRVPPRAVVISVIVGLTVTLTAALLPAQRATRVPPVQAMTGARSEKLKGLGARTALGLTMAGVGAAGILVGLFGHPGHDAVWAGIGMGLVTIGVAIASPMLGRPVIWAVGRGYRAVFGEVGQLAELNAIRQPRRTAATASALMIGLTLVSLMTVFGASARASISEQVHQSLRGDFLIGSQGFKDFPAAVATDAAKLDGVSSVHAMSTASFQLVGADGRIQEAQGNGQARQLMFTVGGMKASDLDQMFPQEITSGRMFRAPGEVIVSQDAASYRSLHTGSTFTGYNSDKQKKITFTVVGLFSSGDGLSGAGIWTSQDTFDRVGLGSQDSFVSVDLAPGADREAVRAGLDRATADMPLVSVMDIDEYAAEQMAQVNQILVFIYALLGLSVVIAILGIVNTLGLSIIERTREIGLLRAIALKRRDIRRMITLESVLIALLGAVVGLILGVCFGAVLQRLLVDDGIIVLSVPWLQLLIFLVAAAVVGVLAAVWPARRATRVNVLTAIATE
ncbi:ABC transporter permease [Acidipropionibacterium jensenii]|uniref:ABC transporter permease n=1 Tax=Acidipropionibacterium jensenii TaxID=1749 RepID=UPI00214BFDF0